MLNLNRSHTRTLFMLAALLLGALLVSTTLLHAQPPQQLSLGAPAPPAVSAGGAVSGTPGATPLFYWVIANYPAGAAVSLPVVVPNTVGAANLNATNFVTIRWAPVSGATSYSVVRATTPLFPGTCATCGIATNVVASSANDQGTTTAYLLPTVANNATATLFLNNTLEAQPYLQLQLNASLYRIAPLNGAYVVGHCVQFAAFGTLADSGASNCGGGGTIPLTTSALRGDGLGNASAVTGAAGDCVLVAGTSAPCSNGAQVCVVTMTSTTILTLAANATSTTPCVLNNVRFITPVTMTISARGGTLSVYAQGTTLIAGYGGGTFLNGDVTSVGATATFGITAFPNPTDGTIPLWTWTAAAGLWNVSGGVKFLSEASAQTFTAGTNIVLTKTPTGLTIDASGGAPGGADKECQYNNAGAFGGVTGSDCSGSNFIITRNGTFGANGRAAIGQNGGGNAVYTTADHFSNSYVVTTEPNAIGEAILRLGPLATTGVVLWLRGAMQLIPGGAQYTCDSTTRGMFFVTDSAAGVKDKVEVCAKDAGDAYAWRTIY